MGPGKVAAQVMLERLLRSRTFARVAQRGFTGNLKQVTAFLAKPDANMPDVKERVLGRVAAEVDRTRGSLSATPWARWWSMSTSPGTARRRWSYW